MLDASTLLELDRVVSSFYEAAIGNIKWSEPLELASKALNSPVALFSVRDPATRRAHFSFGNFGTDPNFVQTFAETYAVLSPFVMASVVSVEGDVVNPIELIGRAEYEKGRFFKEWSAPQGYHDFLGSILIRHAKAIYTIAFGRKADRPLYDLRDHEILRFLVPHVTRALQISERINSFALQRAELMATLDVLATPIVMVGRDRQIHQCNAAARALISQDIGLRADDNTLQFETPVLDSEFQHHVQFLKNRAVELSQKFKNGMVVQILAHQIDQVQGFPDPSTDRLLVVVDWPKRKVAPIGAELKLRFGLTIAELRLLTLIVGGGSIKSSAADIGVSQNTIRTQLRSIFVKTQTNSQKSLVLVVIAAGKQDALVGTNGDGLAKVKH
jgi:DNA-binding CsgD family transcriptional regulator